MKRTKMYFNVQIFLCVLFYFKFGNSVRNSQIVNDIYWNILEMQALSNITDTDYSADIIFQDHNYIINMTKIQWVAVCKNTFKDLKNDEAYANKHVNLLATYMYNGERCSKTPVWVPKLKQHVPQYACACFINPAVISVDIPHEYMQYYQETVMIYPRNFNEMMVFSSNMVEGGYNILEIIGPRSWYNHSFLKVETIKTAVPQSYSEISNLLIILNPIFEELRTYSTIRTNVVNRSRLGIGFTKICKTVFNRAKYAKEIDVSQIEDVLKDEKARIIVLRTRDKEPKLTLIISNTCIGYSPNTSTITTRYKIAAGPGDTSVLVLTETDCPNNAHYLQNESHLHKMKCYEIIELIEHLSLGYIKLLFG